MKIPPVFFRISQKKRRNQQESGRTAAMGRIRKVKEAMLRWVRLQ